VSKAILNSMRMNTEASIDVLELMWRVV